MQYASQFSTDRLHVGVVNTVTVKHRVKKYILLSWSCGLVPSDTLSWGANVGAKFSFSVHCHIGLGGMTVYIFCNVCQPGEFLF